ncbi:LysR family transcriptional regulator [Gudongella oleilytica]|jgi:DNA-binding transcriptional LysR family regulator|uniref:LysR family transcriptional regulator n=1 Tax=Gudongella oleilytica TaxID=1582259 RepID=UPI002A369CAA|nr:LysR family transcriptional regulator [Gudongella oleilytica]MDY0257210.1 LysR family transcriptional regulator [Gudongella oleilytica]
MTLQQLKYFVEMSYMLHYTKAAEELNISQPSLSYALNQLSEELGAPLFKKDGKKVYLTEFGEAFLPYAESALNILSQGEQHIKKMLNPTAGIINLGYIYSVSFDAVPSLIDEFYVYQGNRNIHFNFQVNMTHILRDKLMDGSLDVVLAPMPESPSDHIDYLPIFKQELFLVVYNSHPLAGRTSITVEDFKDDKLVMINRKTNLYIETENMFKRHNIMPDVAFTVDECNSMAAFVGAQLGIAVMPNIPSLENYKVTAIPFEGRTMNRTICLIWNKKRQLSPAMKSFIDYYRIAQAENR